MALEAYLIASAPAGVPVVAVSPLSESLASALDALHGHVLERIFVEVGR